MKETTLVNIFVRGGNIKPSGGWIAVMVGGFPGNFSPGVSLGFWSLLQMLQPSIFPMLKSDILIHEGETPLDYKVPKQGFSSLAMPYGTMNDVSVFADGFADGCRILTKLKLSLIGSGVLIGIKFYESIKFAIVA